jgi:hypothetical protein
MEATMQMQTETPVFHTDRSTLKKHSLISSDRVEGTSVRRPGGARIGAIQRIMIDKVSGQVAYAVLSFGGIFGIGQKHLPIPWAQLKYNPDTESYEIDLSDEQLKAAPNYEADKDFDWGDRSQEIVIHNYDRKQPYWGY